MSENPKMTPYLRAAMELLPPQFPQDQLNAVKMVLIRDFAGYRFADDTRQKLIENGTPCETWGDILAIQKELPGLQAKTIISDADAAAVNAAVEEFEKCKPDTETIYNAFKKKEIAVTRLREMLQVHSKHLAEETGENTARAIVTAIANTAGRAISQLKLKSINLQSLRDIDDVYSMILLACQIAGMWEGGRTEAQRVELVKENGDPFGFPNHIQLMALADGYDLVSLPTEKLVTEFEGYAVTLFEVCDILNGRKTDMTTQGQSWPQPQEPPDSYADELAEISKITSSTARNYLAANDTLSNHLNSQTKCLQINEEIRIPDSRQAAKTVFIPASLESEFELSRPINEYDRAVSNAVYSLMDAGNKAVTAAMIYRTMTGKTDGEAAPPAALKRIDESMEKMAVIRVTADLTDAAAARKVQINGQPIGKGQPLKIKNYLLPTESVTVKIKGKTTIAYKILSTPPLYAWAKMTRQITTMPAEVMDVKKVRGGRISCQSESASETRTAVKSYLLRQLAAIYERATLTDDIRQKNRPRTRGKTDKKDGPYTGSIRYDSVMRAAGVDWDGLTRPMKVKYRTFIKDCLTNWQNDPALSFNGFMFEEYKEKTKIIGLRITYPQC